MRLLQPTTVDEAVGLLTNESDAKCLAGGQTLAAMMNAELIEPDALTESERALVVRKAAETVQLERPVGNPKGENRASNGPANR